MCSGRETAEHAEDTENFRIDLFSVSSVSLASEAVINRSRRLSLFCWAASSSSHRSSVHPPWRRSGVVRRGVVGELTEKLPFVP